MSLWKRKSTQERLADRISKAEQALERGEHERALTLCGSEIESLESQTESNPSGQKDLVRARDVLLVLSASALWRGRKDSVTALELCYSAVQRVGARRPGFDLIREIGGLDASNARPFQLLCHGKVLTRFLAEGVDPASIPKEERRFVATYFALADAPEEALEFARSLERREWGANFRSLESEKVSEPREVVGGCKGVYFRSGRTFYSGPEG